MAKGFRTQQHRRYEVWVSNNSIDADEPGGLRFNAGFSTVARALEECEWYHEHGYRACVMDANSNHYTDWRQDAELMGVWWNEYKRINGKVKK
jgi:hypothetical protein